MTSREAPLSPNSVSTQAAARSIICRWDAVHPSLLAANASIDEMANTTLARLLALMWARWKRRLITRMACSTSGVTPSVIVS